ncbi:tetratricopeptide repeat protein [Martelella alba]|uniref:Ancillary SecYEG translocon subunit n=1 Tax=Martelella alba TaxID=2590451 RepID=A0A506UFD4_9HYPH|nr:tetratricopeptide repeat protein [Martelella alba]TPW31665.1 tetratricopeptide repeat protein [Martelella alba]
MANQNDSFIREVNEELRSDRMRDAWRRYGRYLIALAVLAVVGTAAWRGYEYWQDRKAASSGDIFMTALNQIKAGDNDAAKKTLAELEASGHGDYPVLAKLRAATLLEQNGDTAAAVSAFSAIGKDRGIPEALRQAAKLRAGWLLVDTGTYDQVSSEVEELAVDGNPFRFSAREILGLSAFRNGNYDEAKQLFDEITADSQAPVNILNRAQIVLDVMAADGDTKPDAAPAVVDQSPAAADESQSADDQSTDGDAKADSGTN